MFRSAAATLALLGLAACNSSGSQSDAPSPQATPSGEVAAAPAPPPMPTEIPQRAQGRWGLVAQDCTSTRGDAKGLLVIGPKTLKFYESVGTLSDITENGPNRLRASFAFTGEGMEWQREEVLDVQDDGQHLVRREFGKDAIPGPLRYTRCE